MNKLSPSRLLGLFIALFLVFNYSKAQDLPEIVSPNPEVSSLAKYVDVPVNASTGVPNITIPFFNIGNNEISVPISLSYHASGIRVNEIASREGLGWSLIAGGAISRSVRGIPDDYSSNGFLNSPPSRTVASFLNTDMIGKFNLLENSESYDFESDIYHFNFLGYSGKFFFDQNGNIPITNPKTDLKIVPIQNNTGNIISWEVTTPDGTSFYFGKSIDGLRRARDTSTPLSISLQSFGGGSIPWPDPPNAMNDYTTSWKLMDIKTRTGQIISFHYSPYDINFCNFLGEQVAYSTTGVAIGYPSTQSFTCNYDTTHRLESITSNSGTVDFIYDFNQRQDLNNDFALKSVILKNKLNQVVDQYNLHHDYFISPYTDEHLGVDQENQALKRLYLKKVEQVIQNETNKIFTLAYNTDYMLPNRFSMSQDHWGYYNGENNTVFYPTTKWYLNGTYIIKPGANRKVREAYAKACTLKSITYPTGGKTEFNLESNKANVSLIELADFQNIEIGIIRSNSPQESVVQTDVIINDPEEYIEGIYWDVDFGFDCINQNSIDCPKATLYKIDPITSNLTILAESSGSNLNLGIGISPNPMHLRLKIENYSTSHGQPFNSVISTIYGANVLYENEEEIGGFVGGLRVKSISMKDSNDNTLLSKNYSYTRFNDPTLTSGASLSAPSYLRNDFTSQPSSDFYHSNLSWSVVLLKSNSVQPISNASNYASIYTNVTEYQNDGNNGKTEYTYSFTPNGKGDMGSSTLLIRTQQGNQFFPILGMHFSDNIPTGDYAHRRGLLLNKKVYKAIEEGSNTQFSLVHETINKYHPFDLDNTLYSDNAHISFSVDGSVSAYTKYRNLSERHFLTEEIQRDYFEDTYAEVKTNHVFDPTYQGRTFSTGSVTTDSKGDVFTRNRLFADDIGHTTLINQHRIAEPIVTKTFRLNNGESQETKISEQKTIYDFFNGLYLPQTIQTSKGSGSLQDRITYHDYDSIGNPLEVSKADGTSIVYIWGYNQQYPIAKIENATYSQVESFESDLQTKSNADDDRTIGNIGNEGLLRTELNALRNLLPNAMVTTYTYDPLIGVTSMTDAKGYTTYYEYDVFNRLKRVKDAQGNILAENNYHYKNQ